MYKVSKKRLQSVTSHIDTIYELTKEGYEGTFKSLGSASLNKVVAELFKRGVIKTVKEGGKTIHRWAATSAPTKNFYASVATVIGLEQRERDVRYNNKNKAKKEKIFKELLDSLPESFTLEDCEDKAEVTGVPKSMINKWVSSLLKEKVIFKVPGGYTKVAPHEEEKVEAPIIKVENTLKTATIEELWAELKSRGVEIENNHLVVIERRVLA